MGKNNFDLDSLIQLRRHLHSRPELSGLESGTARAVGDFLRAHTHAEVIENLGGEGLAAVFETASPGPTIMFRADLDALPIQETAAVAYRSRVEGVAHLCGHDGHMAILCGLAQYLSARPPRKGRAVLLFQPAEETGSGAARIIADRRFGMIRPDMAFALHNLPGYPAGAVVWRRGVCASASRGLVVRLEGRSAQAGDPRKGISPVPAMAALLERIPCMPEIAGIKGFALATVVHVRLGEVAFGTAPGEAVVMATLRSHLDEDMERIFRAGEDLARDVAAASGLKVELEAREDFPALINHDQAVECVLTAAATRGLAAVEAGQPMPWSEDFARFTRICPGALFGLGAGESHVSLHNPDYDFPDALITPGVNIFAALADDLLV